MLRTVYLVLPVTLLVAILGDVASGQQGAADRITTGAAKTNFDHFTVDQLPSAVRPSLTGEGTQGRWAVIADPSAPSKPNVLAQLSTDPTSKRYLLAVVGRSSILNGQAAVRIKTVSGVQDQGAGLAFRITNERNYYVIRANSIERNFRLYKFIDGVRTAIGGVDLSMNPGEWHEIAASFNGSRIRCFYDGRQLLDVSDDALAVAGAVGVWTKADSVTYFDDLVAQGR
jgi:hypothetical protein